MGPTTKFMYNVFDVVGADGQSTHESERLHPYKRPCAFSLKCSSRAKKEICLDERNLNN